MLQDILPSIMIVIVSCIMLTAFIYILAMMQKCEDVKQLGRKYILVMESEGSLSDVQKAALVGELKDLGIREDTIEFDSATTTSKVRYGETVKLIFSVKVPLISTNKDREENLWNMAMSSTMQTYKVSIASTAKR